MRYYAMRSKKWRSAEQHTEIITLPHRGQGFECENRGRERYVNNKSWWKTYIASGHAGCIGMHASCVCLSDCPIDDSRSERIRNRKKELSYAAQRRTLPEGRSYSLLSVIRSGN